MYDVAVVKIYTRTGDGGETSLFSGGRVEKDHPRIEAYGTIDELCSHLGLLRCEDLPDRVDTALTQIQEAIFAVGSMVADADGKLTLTPSAWSPTPLEELIDDLEHELEPLTCFILPGGSRAASLAHVARTVCRRAERRLISIDGGGASVDGALIYLNRLSDALFVIARTLNHRDGIDEPTWNPPR